MITAIVLHYNRQQNIPKVMAGIRSQTVPCKIVVWDNSGNYPVGSGEDVVLKAEKNTFCLARYELIKSIKTKYIFNTDDDLALNRPDIFEKFIEFSERHPKAVIGWNGRKFHPKINWEKAYSFPNTGHGGGWVDYNPEENILCDVINFGVSFFPVNLFGGIELNPFTGPLAVSEAEFRNGDDIWISAVMEANGIERRVMPFNLKPCFDWLEEGQYALSKEGGHMDRRDVLCKRFFQGKYP